MDISPPSADKPEHSLPEVRLVAGDDDHDVASVSLKRSFSRQGWDWGQKN